MSGVQTIEVDETDAGIRLDRWFRRHYPDLAHGRLEKLARTGQIRVDGHRIKTSTRLEPGQSVRVPPLGTLAPRSPANPRAQASDKDLAMARELVIFQDDEILVLNKPPGLAVQGGSGVTRHVDAMLDGLRFGYSDRPKLAHRLDKDTSGILVLGRTTAATARLAAAFRDKSTRKVYWALTVGIAQPRQGKIDLALGKLRVGAGERMGPDPQAGKAAQTYYSVLQRAGKKVAWLALMPITGRTHQLRVHCAEIGTPILGDGKYGGRGAFLPGLPDFDGLMLHARSIDLPHPSRGMLSIEAPLPNSMAKAWDYFGFDLMEGAAPFRNLQL